MYVCLSAMKVLSFAARVWQYYTSVVCVYVDSRNVNSRSESLCRILRKGFCYIAQYMHALILNIDFIMVWSAYDLALDFISCFS